MTDAEKIEKYKNIVYRLRIINNKIEGLNSSILKLEDTISKNIVVNDKIYNSEQITSIKNSLSSASSSIKGNIIPSLNKKIYN